MEARKVWKQCDGCGRRRLLDARKRHWCRCHPAGFRMIPDVSRLLAARAVGAVKAMMDGIR